MTTETPPTPRTYLFLIIACSAACAQLVWASASRASGLQVPAPVGYLTAAAFGLAALRLVEMWYRPHSAGDGFAALLLGALASVAGWIAFFPGPRVCTASSSFGASSQASGLGCRIPFGIGAIVTGIVALYAARHWMRARLSGASADIAVELPHDIE